MGVVGGKIDPILGRPKLPVLTNDWTPWYLGPQLLGFWDANDEASIDSSGGLVSAWRDLVAGYAPVQASDAAKPTLSATSFNGGRGITFDGVADYLSLESSPFPAGATPSEIWLLVDQLTGGGVGTTYMFAYGTANSDTVSRNVGRVGIAGTNRARIGVQGSFATDTLVNFSGRHVERAQFGATQSGVSVDGSAATTVAAVPATGSTRVRMGCNINNTPGSFTNMVVSAAIVTSALSTDQATQLMAWGKARGQIA